MDINLSDYYSAGYFLTRRAKRPFWLDEPVGLVPVTFISLESSFYPKLNIVWTWNPENRVSAEKFGIKDEQWQEFQEWCKNAHHQEIDASCMFYSTAFVRKFIQQFFSDNYHDLIILGVGMHHTYWSEWMKVELHPNAEGVETRILQKLSIEEGGTPLGFDISSYAHGDFDHTWFSHGLYVGIYQTLGIRPNQDGLINTRDDALHARNYANQHDKHFYDEWLLISYPLMLDAD
jgi:hypothetical protein